MTKPIDAAFAEVRSALAEHGFVQDGKNRRLFRERENWIDVFETYAGQVSVKRLSGTPAFKSEFGAFLKGADHPMGATINGFKGFPVDSVASCHFRQILFPPALYRSPISTDHWHGKLWSVSGKSALGQMRVIIDELILPWLARLEDIDEIKKYVAMVASKTGTERFDAQSSNVWGRLYGVDALHRFLNGDG